MEGGVRAGRVMGFGHYVRWKGWFVLEEEDKIVVVDMYSKQLALLQNV